jgi:uncharacterized protein with ParB-like and HNH nuclease domain
MNFKDIKRFPHSSYKVDASWDYLEEMLKSWDRKETPLLLQPDFQRGYVWSKFQQESYIEYCLRGGRAALDIFFNCPSWQGGYCDPIELIDGQQRLGAVRAFLRNEVKAYGNYYSEFEGRLHSIDNRLTFHMFCIKDRRDLLNFYIELNTGGSVHTETDLAPAYEELEKLK